PAGDHLMQSPSPPSESAGESTRTTARAAPPAAWWLPGEEAPLPGTEPLRAAIADLQGPFCVVGNECAGGGVRDSSGAAGRVTPAVARGGSIDLGRCPSGDAHPLLAYAPASPPESLGDPEFRRIHGSRLSYVAGSMANGIASAELVEAMARAGMLAFFGAAGLSLPDVERAIDRLQGSLGEIPHGFNLIHSPAEPELEAAVADLYLRRRVRLVEASAYLDLTLPLARYRVHGIHRHADGSVIAPNRVVAKVSRVEVARRFLSPPPAVLLDELVRRGEITAGQAGLAAAIPMAEDITAEADSGGHTDNRPAIALLPAIIALRDRLQARHRYARRPRVGLAGGISTPAAAAAAFAMGAAYLLTGSINQACVEAGTSEAVRRLLAEAEQADVAMAPAADMFEMGVKVQVLKRGTLFPMRAAKLYQLYRAFDGVASIPAAERRRLEDTIFRAPLEEIWSRARAFFLERDRSQVARAEGDEKHRMALIFRWYLGRSSSWANRGEPDRSADYQVWCGPSMGAFNEWVRGSFLEGPRHRRVATVARCLMRGAAILTRVQALRAQGLDPPPEAVEVGPGEHAPDALEAAPGPARG
ncbi:MAG: PfaD family polyunsaturated fatty acid/polyketide biosynthesis protein, partial [Planctomycetota bacterium]